MFNIFIENCKKCYTPEPFFFVDEMLVAFRGRSSFRMYVPQKPAKYGLKIQCLTDAKPHCMVNAYLYTDECGDCQTLSEEERKFSKPKQSVQRLTPLLMNTGRNMTGDNWFSALELAKESKERKLTFEP